MPRRAAGLLLILAMLVPMANASPSPAATSGETCIHVSGAAFFTPPLPPQSSKATVPSFGITTKGMKLYTCSGPGGTSGNASFTVRKLGKTNCTGFTRGADRKSAGAGAIKWAKGKPSNITVTLVFVPNSFSVQLTGKVTSGQFSGSTINATLTLTIDQSQCVSQPLTKARIAFAKGTQFVIS